MNPNDWQPIETAPKNKWIKAKFANGVKSTACLIERPHGEWTGWVDLQLNDIVTPTHWRPLSNPEPERTSDENCPKLTSGSSNATGSERPIRTESVATVGGTPIADTEGVAAPVPTCVPVDNRTIWQKLEDAQSDAEHIVRSIEDFREELRKGEPHKATLRAQSKRISSLETDLLAARAEVERLTKERDSFHGEIERLRKFLGMPEITQPNHIIDRAINILKTV